MIYNYNQNWGNYIKIYEEFVKGIPDELKNIFNKVRKDVGGQTSSFKKILDLEKYGLVKDVKIFLDVSYEKSNYSNYYSNINIFELLNPIEYKTINIPIHIRDVSIDNDKLISIISHEIRHIYDFYLANDDSDIESFLKSLYLNKLKNDNVFHREFNNFLNLVYLSFEHELIARNTMIYENFINCNCSKEELFSLFEKTYIYESLIRLKEFKHEDVLKISKNELIQYTNLFLEFFKENKIDDIEKYYQNWEIYFKSKSDEYLKEAYNVLNDIYNKKIYEHFHPNEYPSYKENINMKNIILKIHENFDV